jgi:hypothetical protein
MPQKVPICGTGYNKAYFSIVMLSMQVCKIFYHRFLAVFLNKNNGPI